MKYSCRKTDKPNILLIIAIILYTASVFMYALLYSNNGGFHIYNASTAVEVKAVVELEINEAISDTRITNTVKNAVFHMFKADSSSKVISIFSCAAISNSLDFHPFLFIIFMILFSVLFISLPDDWTLLGQKVRLND